MGDVEFHFHHSPGHTGDSMIIECQDICLQEIFFYWKWWCWTYDLPSGRAHLHWQALDVLERFSDDTLVCTRHDPPNTEMQTMGWNRENNPILKMETYEEYARWQKHICRAWLCLKIQNGTT